MNKKEKPQPMTEKQLLEHLSKRKSCNTIEYPDGIKGQLNKAVIIL